MELQQGFMADGMGLNRHCAQQQFNRPKCRYGSKASFWATWTDVRYYPQSDRDRDVPDGR